MAKWKNGKPLPYKEMLELQEKAIAKSKHPVLVILREDKLKQDRQIYEDATKYLLTPNTNTNLA